MVQPNCLNRGVILADSGIGNDTLGQASGNSQELQSETIAVCRHRQRRRPHGDVCGGKGRAYLRRLIILDQRADVVDFRSHAGIAPEGDVRRAHTRVKTGRRLSLLEQLGIKNSAVKLG